MGSWTLVKGSEAPDIKAPKMVLDGRELDQHLNTYKVLDNSGIDDYVPSLTVMWALRTAGEGSRTESPGLYHQQLWDLRLGVFTEALSSSTHSVPSMGIW